MDNYAQKWDTYREDPIKYWEKMALKFKWFKPWNKVFDNSDPIFPKWFCGGELNLSYDLLDRQVEEGRGDDVISVFDSFYTKETRNITYRDLLSDVSKLAGAFHDECGIEKGDHVMIYMPMIPESLISMLASCRLGAVYYVMMGSYNEQAIAERIDDYQPKLVVVASAEFEGNKPVNIKDKMDRSIDLATHTPSKCLVFQRQGMAATRMNDNRDIDFSQAMDNAEPHGYVPVEANSPLFMVYTSGTTGKPKGIVHSARSMAIGTVQDDASLLGNSDDKMCWIASTYGWIAGQIAMVYMALFWNKPCILYEGPIINPDAHEVYRLLSTYKVNVLFFSTAAQRVVMQQDPDGKIGKQYQPFCVTKLYSGGCPGDVRTFNWTASVIGAQVLQLYGSTEVGGIATSFYADDGKRAEDQPMLSSGKPTPGWQMEILKEGGERAAVDESGRLAIKFPLPPTLMSTIYRNEERYKNTYFTEFPGYYDMKDDAKFDKNGYLYILNRSDDVFKAMGHRIGCSGVEEALMSHPDVAECVVVTKVVTKNGIPTDIPVGFFMMKNGANKSANSIAEDLVTIVHEQIGNFVTFPKPHLVDSFPKTISGKVARGILQDLVRNIELKSTKELEDPHIQSFVKAIRAMNDN